jgi:hypothetical protein
MPTMHVSRPKKILKNLKGKQKLKRLNLKLNVKNLIMIFSKILDLNSLLNQNMWRKNNLTNYNNKLK